MKIEYCPTQMMLVDYFTKLLKGKVLKIFRDSIMGYKPISSLELTPVSIKECVENNGEMHETSFDWKWMKLFLIEEVMWYFWVTKYDPETKNEKRLQNMIQIQSK